MSDVIHQVHLLGGPLDGLMQGWNIDELPELVRISPSLAQNRGGMRLEVTSPSMCGVLRDHERAADEVLYRQREPGRFFFDPVGYDFDFVHAPTP